MAFTAGDCCRSLCLFWTCAAACCRCCLRLPGIKIKEEEEVDGNASHSANGGRTQGHHTFQQPSAHRGPQLPVSANKSYPLNPNDPNSFASLHHQVNGSGHPPQRLPVG